MDMIGFHQHILLIMKTGHVFYSHLRIIRKTHLPDTFLWQSSKMIKLLKNKYYESDYKNITQKLLYEDMSYDYVIEHGLAKMLDCDIFEYKKDR